MTIDWFIKNILTTFAATVLFFSSCGDMDISSYQTQQPEDCRAEQTCKPHSKKICGEDNNSYWYDSCDNLEGLADECLDQKYCYKGRCFSNLEDENNFPDYSEPREKLPPKIINPKIAFYLNNPFLLEPLIEEYCTVIKKYAGFCDDNASTSYKQCIENASLISWATLAAKNCAKLKVDLLKNEYSCDRQIYVELPIIHHSDGTISGGNIIFCNNQPNYCYNSEGYSYVECFGYWIKTPCNPETFKKLRQEFEDRCQ